MVHFYISQEKVLTAEETSDAFFSLEYSFAILFYFLLPQKNQQALAQYFA